MQRLMFTMTIAPGQIEEYERRHAAVWPELMSDLLDSGFRNYSLFRRGRQVYAYAECHPDVATALDKLGRSEVNDRWSAWFSDVLEEHTDANGDLMRAAEVWSLEESAAQAGLT